MDVDIDTQTTFDPKVVFPFITRASVVNSKNELIPHACGYYFQNIPIDPVTKLSAIPYEQAEELGFEKFDFLHLSLLDNFKSNHQIDEMLTIEPNWDMLYDPDVVKKLFHLGTIDENGNLKHFKLICKIGPKNVEELADCLALIRPAKINLIDQYINDKQNTRKLLYKETEQYYFKKSHAISYAMNIVLQLHLIDLQII